MSRIFLKEIFLQFWARATESWEFGLLQISVGISSNFAEILIFAF